MKSLIVGMGIGNLYRDVLTSIGAEIVTVDTNPDAGADYTDLTEAVNDHGFLILHTFALQILLILQLLTK